MKYGIASFGRSDCGTVKTLLKAGIKKEDIVISVQTEDDYKTYKEKHDVEVIYSPNDCAGGNRNNILKNIDGDICLLDDDITSFSYWNGEKYVRDTQKTLELLLKSLNEIVDDVAIIGIAASGNGMVRKGRDSVSYLTPLQGTVLIIKDKSLLFDERWKMVEDYEISLRVINTGRTTIRLNDYVANKPKNGSNKGGLHKRYERGELPLWITRLSKVYPQFKPNKDRTGGCVKL